MNSSELKELLRATTAFSILSDRELDHLADGFELVHYALGQDVVGSAQALLPDRARPRGHSSINPAPGGEPGVVL